MKTEIIQYIQITDDEQYGHVFSTSELDELSNFMSHTKPQSKEIIEWFLASIENKPIGSLWMELRENKTFIGLFILKEFRGQGYGRLVLNHIVGISKENGCRAIYLNVRENNLSAIKLYESYGFSKVKRYTNSLGISAIEYVLKI